ncbi:Long-chain-fatty-acid--CoA ligase [Flexistipes sinusarabici DSM 4947]|uniref:Long-chain-fatty-acid--CoA ligase n=2 Tax=Flexistipes sinusarabici TaxID=2352 RepID=F8E4E6_FLESM|nr:AMP-binding protein [Flexistipes sinusarabici]AEI14432.1 Long-chain-fatty-acid--CoA ligase [Flexistipes sinusarabici DSM 4947]
MEGFSEIKQTMGGLLEEIAKNYPENDALVYPFRNLRLTYKELDKETDKLAKGLVKLGVKKGDHIAVWAHNIPEWVLLLYATAKIGAVLVTVNTLYRSRELSYILKQSDAKMLFLVEGFKMQNYVETVYDILPELKETSDQELNFEEYPFLKRVVFIGDRKHTGMFDYYNLYKIGEDISDAQLKAKKDECSYQDVINMQYTSGTTGFPKGVMLTHHNLLNNAYAIGQCMRFSDKDRLCIPVPFFHCFGLVLSILVCQTHGAAMIPVESFNPLEVLKSVEREKCTALHGVPTMFISELQLLEKENFDLSHLRTGIMAGSTCPIEVMRKVIDKMNMTDITIVYGQTESSPGITQTRVDDDIDVRVSTVGRELPGIEAKIVDPETGRECAPGVQGEMCARGYNVMKGYYKMPEATAKAIDNEGWLHTGDLAVKTEEGNYVITGRIKDMIIRGGENIYPREIEEFLYTHPAVEDVQIVGVPDKKYGEEIMAFVKIYEEYEDKIKEKDIMEYCKEQIADYKVPRYVEFVSEYPMTASGKIQKYKLREKAIEKYSLQER